VTNATQSGESDAVLAFLAERRGPVLDSAIADLSAAEVGDLPDVVHRLRGILGSYGLDEAHVHITELSEIVGGRSAAGGATTTQAEAARRRTLTALRRLQQGDAR
jgi:hypothetical protein